MRKVVEKKTYLSDPSLHTLVERVLKGEVCTKVGGLHGSAQSLVVSILNNAVDRPVVLVCPSQEEAEAYVRDLTFFLGEERVFLLPFRDMRYPEDVVFGERERAVQRIETLVALLNGRSAVTVIPLEALMQKVAPLSAVGDYIDDLAMGDLRDRDQLLATLYAGGYRRVPLVEEKGEFALRGFIVDIFPPAREHPLRLEFAGDEIESIREFDVTTQRSKVEVLDFTLPPTGEAILTEEGRLRVLQNLRHRMNRLDLPRAKRDRLIEMVEMEPDSLLNLQILPLLYRDEAGGPSGLDTVFDYLPRRSVIVTGESRDLPAKGRQIEDAIDRFLFKADREEKFYLERDVFSLSAEECLRRLDGFQRVDMDELPLSGDGGLHVMVEKHSGLRREAATVGRENGLLTPLADQVRDWLNEGMSVYFLSADGERARMEHLLEGYSLPVARSDASILSDLARRGTEGRLILKAGRIAEGFSCPGLKLVIITEEEIFGKKIKKRRRARAREGYFLKSFGELKAGDFVVHVDHGIGRYHELKRLSIGNQENDYLLIEYLGGDRLYIPVERLDQIQRYLGPDGHMPPVDKLGGSSWDAVKKRVKKSVREIAEELVSIYAAREVMTGHQYAPGDRYYEEFCSSFAYEETPDQAQAIDDVNIDLSEPKSMDRLICGDAGFGKTEVALRASFRVAMNGKQVAILVPTTILAEQHYHTFKKRFEKYPLRIEVLNRFRTAAQQKKIVEEVNRGTVDVVIGTHRLLQKDVLFRDLGLVIIDEEQRFGVSHKEKLKKLRTLVEVLTMTATPIPRTLQLSLVGIRDLSVINTPPQDRQSVKVEVSEFDEEMIARAIRQELARDGQVFFVHDRVRSIYSMARMVERLVPEAKIGVAHGQMKPKELEDVIVRFVRGDMNVLVCTTIIGSGVDMPMVNTIIINRADRFGLSSLYQLRGRVGRSSESAFAYLFVPRGMVLSRDARKRLRVVQEYSDPGSGFKVATQDLEIRGAGNLLGVSQSGQISAVGYELYMELMEKTVSELRGEPVPEEDISPEIHFGIPAFIPDDYIQDMQIRLVTYKKISTAASDDELADLREELSDRYGFVPAHLENLLGIIGVRNELKKIRAEKMEYDGSVMCISLRRDSAVDPSCIMELARGPYRGLRLAPDYTLSVPFPGLAGGEIIGEARRLTAALTAGPPPGEENLLQGG